MAGALDIDDDMERMVLRKDEATMKGGHALQRLLQLAETRRDPEQRPGPARCPVHRRDLQRRGLPVRPVRAARGRPSHKRQDAAVRRRAALGPIRPAQPGVRRRPAASLEVKSGHRTVAPEVARRAVTTGHPGD